MKKRSEKRFLKLPVLFLAICILLALILTSCANNDADHANDKKNKSGGQIKEVIPPGTPRPEELDMSYYAADPEAFMSRDPRVDALVIPETGKYFWEKPTTASYPAIDAPEKFRIEVSTAEQRVHIFRDDEEVCTLVCSTGLPESPTVKGDFELFAKRGDTFYTERFGGGNFWVTFYGTYLFHSVPIDSDGNYIIEEAIKLGSPASHGCVRLSIADARWFYNNMPAGIPVKVY